MPVTHCTDVSIHAPRAGGDVPNPFHYHPLMFQSTPPARGATESVRKASWSMRVSIHAPRAGGDDKTPVEAQVPGGFNPRPPRGGRRVRSQRHGMGRRFQSTPPARGATQGGQGQFVGAGVSIHAPRAGGDGMITVVTDVVREFQSTPPARGATPGA